MLGRRSYLLSVSLPPKLPPSIIPTKYPDPLYSKTEPLPALPAHFALEVFKQSQSYGKTRQTLPCTSYTSTLPCSSSASTQYTSSWTAAGRLLALAGYGSEYEVRRVLLFKCYVSLSHHLLFISRSFNPSDSCSSCAFYPILTLPLSVYQTFVLEEKHGFNKTTPSLFVVGVSNSWALALVSPSWPPSSTFSYEQETVLCFGL